MELRSFKVRAAAGHVRAVTVDVEGEAGRDLQGEAAAAVIAAAEPLFTALAEALGGPLRALSYDGDGDVLRVTPAEAAVIDPGRLTLRGASIDAYVPALQAIARAILGELRAREGDPRRAPGAGPGEGPGEGPSPSDPDFWEALYRRGFTGWELGRPAPPLARYFAATPPRGLRALVVGCGRGNEARMLAEAGAEVTAIDLAPTAIAQARGIPSPQAIDYRVADVFDLRGQPAAYDLVVEHTCFCAIDPSRRDDFVAAVADALVPGGALVGLFYAHDRPGGPPFGVSDAELRRRFAPRFTIDHLELAADSVITRRGDELLGRLIRRADDAADADRR